MPSVANQTYAGEIEHIIVSDGPWTATLHPAEYEASNRRLKFIELGRNWHQFSSGASYGAIPRLVGTHMCHGKYIGYLDDDDEYLPEHVEKLVKFIEETKVDWCYSIFKRFWSDGRQPDLIGHAVSYGCIGTPIIFHRAECLLYGNWSLEGYSEDFRLVDTWTKKGLKHARLPEVTVHVHKQV